MTAPPLQVDSRLREAMACAFMAGYASDRPGEELTVERIDRIQEQFDEWWGQLVAEKSRGLPPEGEPRRPESLFCGFLER